MWYQRSPNTTYAYVPTIFLWALSAVKKITTCSLQWLFDHVSAFMKTFESKHVSPSLKDTTIAGLQKSIACDHVSDLSIEKSTFQHLSAFQTNITFQHVSALFKLLVYEYISALLATKIQCYHAYDFKLNLCTIVEVFLACQIRCKKFEWLQNAMFGLFFVQFAFVHII